MKSCSAKELKNHTGEILRQVGSGEKVLITKRGKPCAILSPVENGQVANKRVRSFQEAWSGIEHTLRTYTPRIQDVAGGDAVDAQSGLIVVDTNIFVIDLRYPRMDSTFRGLLHRRVVA